MWKLVESEDGDLTPEDVLLLSVMLADTIRRTERRGSSADRERALWEKLQPALKAAQGWVPRETT